MVCCKTKSVSLPGKDTAGFPTRLSQAHWGGTMRAARACRPI